MAMEYFACIFFAPCTLHPAPCILSLVQKTTLDSGLRIVTKHLPSTQAATVLILVGAGSRYESREINGISHFLEHMFFKGAKKYKNSKEVAETIDGIGGDFNAFTGKEYVGYYVKAAAHHVETSLDVLSDMLIHCNLDPKEIDKERGVIMEEYNMYQDTPMYQVGWDFERLMYGDQPMGWDQVGTKEVINGVTREQFSQYKEGLYTADNIVVSIVGNVNHDAVKKLVSRYFKFPQAKKEKSHAPLKLHHGKKRIHLKHKKTEQGHVVVGFEGFPEEDPRHYGLRVLSVILGGNMSSRMFLSVREDKGLSYYISTSTDDFTDSGIVSTRAGVDTKRTPLAVEAICKEYKKICGEKVPAKELTKAKEYLKGKLALRLEDSEEYAHLIGKEQLLYGKMDSPEEIAKKIDAVTAAEVHAIARELFVEEKLRMAAIGPYEDETAFEKVLHL